MWVFKSASGRSYPHLISGKLRSRRLALTYGLLYNPDRHLTVEYILYVNQNTVIASSLEICCGSAILCSPNLESLRDEGNS